LLLRCPLASMMPDKAFATHTSLKFFRGRVRGVFYAV
jgi:hypothetical protein